MNTPEPKFEFDVLFQEEAIRFILNSSDGIEALKYVKNSYFSLLTHSLIMHGIEVVHSNSARVPSKPILRNILTGMFKEKRFSESLTNSDREETLTLVDELFSRPVKDGDMLLGELAKFSSFVELSNEIESLDLRDFASYDTFLSKAAKAIALADPASQYQQGLFLIKGIRDRQLKRQATDVVVPTPFAQLNKLTSAGGYSPGSVIVLLDKPKRLKTTMLVNVARKYMGQKRKILFIDLENGEDPIAARFEQSVARVSLLELLSGEVDQKVQKILRRYRRLGGEVYIRRLPAFSTANDIQDVMDEIYRKYGIKFDMMCIDYLAQMGSLSGKTDDFGRISDAYLDVLNLVAKNGIIHTWTANHVVRQSAKRSQSKYFGDDIAKCIDIVRHAQAVFGLNRTDEEFEAGVVRLEIVEQREGVPSGRVYFRVDPITQRIDELTKKEMAELGDILYNPDSFDEPTEEDGPKTKKKPQGDI